MTFCLLKWSHRGRVLIWIFVFWLVGLTRVDVLYSPTLLVVVVIHPSWNGIATSKWKFPFIFSEPNPYSLVYNHAFVTAVFIPTSKGMHHFRLVLRVLFYVYFIKMYLNLKSLHRELQQVWNWFSQNCIKRRKKNYNLFHAEMVSYTPLLYAADSRLLHDWSSLFC